ncbi:MAG: TonB-dependent receptor plug domain-containing protein, partial [Pseudomonadota bacterium]
MRHTTERRVRAALLAGAASLAFSGAAGAQEDREEILITGLKKASAQRLQDAPVAAAAFGADELDARHVRSLTTLSYATPNVALEDIGTTPGTANFAIRGLGVNSSIPSVDPTVGVFVDGMYLGVNAGVVLDTFDLESVEILRGPQGLLFGRNVTGGAVLVTTTAPGDEVELDARVAVATGLEKTVSARVSAPLIADLLSVKLAAYLSEDDGYFNNLFDGEEFGEDRTTLFRAAARATPTDGLDLTVRYERGTSEGDGPAAQNRGFFDRDGFDFSIDERGLHENEWDQVTAEANLDVGFGDGVITNIFGWRRYDQTTLADIDATEFFLFHSATFL